MGRGALVDWERGMRMQIIGVVRIQGSRFRGLGSRTRGKVRMFENFLVRRARLLGLLGAAEFRNSGAFWSFGARSLALGALGVAPPPQSWKLNRIMMSAAD